MNWRVYEVSGSDARVRVTAILATFSKRQSEMAKVVYVPSHQAITFLSGHYEIYLPGRD